MLTSCRCSSAVEQRFRKPQVKGSIPFIGSTHLPTAVPLSAHGGARGQVMPDTKQEDADALARAMSDAITNGLSTDDIDEIAKMVTAQQPHTLTDLAKQMAEDSESDELPVYAEAPPGMIDIATAAKQHGIKPRTPYGWIDRGVLPVLGKMRGRGAHRVLVCEQTLVRMATTPKNKGGRPRKT